MNEGSSVREGSSLLDDAQDLRNLTRSPHPYLKHGREITQSSEDGQTVQPLSDRLRSGQSSGPGSGCTTSGRPSTAGSSQSGTEADDERPSFARALPAPNLRPRKGLKTGGDEDALLTPSQLDDGGEHVSITSYFPLERRLTEIYSHAPVDEQDRVLRRRLNEFARRVSEIGLVGIIALSVLCGQGVWRMACIFKTALLSHALITFLLILAYPLKLSFVDTRAVYSKPWQRFRVPASFDPATVLYPPVLPVLVALIASPLDRRLILPNVVLGLSSLPQRLFPRSSRLSGLNVIHWFVAVLPVLLAGRDHHGHGVQTWSGLFGTVDTMASETLIMLYPLHHALLQPLHFLTTTSLLMTELHLLSATLINLMLFASSPQTTIIKSCLWIGGLPMFILTARVLHWNLTLARVPKWKLRHPRHPLRKRKSLVGSVTDFIQLQRAVSAVHSHNTSKPSWSDTEDDEPSAKPKKATSVAPVKVVKPAMERSYTQAPLSAVEYCGPLVDCLLDGITGSGGRPRRATLSTPLFMAQPVMRKSTRSRTRSQNAFWCLQLTPAEAELRSWLYGGYLYAVIAMLVLGPVRVYVSRAALNDQEPIGWALGYLFGQVPYFRQFVLALSLQHWVPIPEVMASWSSLYPDMILNMPLLRTTLGAANTRLLLIAYWALVLLLGLLTVFSLQPYVEVDTRRKVFHGTMVVMLLPSTFLDPCACALALSLILAVFLLLEVLRAGQVPPLGKAISRFVAPYVDGRDLRGPVVVSHIFLLIGCAVPLWFSLATATRDDSGWELADNHRDVGMVAGVICVGMGDAAASLVGRRYGRHKWLWVGGKSLEGSAAFAVAVTGGLVFAKGWLVLGGWRDGDALEHAYSPAIRWTLSLVKAMFCACGASFMEAVLTGANDNVVVPVVLWLLVKGTRL